jgi:hypothetical protein
MIMKLDVLEYPVDDNGSMFRTIYPADKVTLIPYKDDKGDIQFLARILDQGFGTQVLTDSVHNTDDITKICKQVNNGQRILANMTQDRDVQREGSRYRFYREEHKMPILISRVLSDVDDTIRIVYAHDADPYPVFICPNITSSDPDKDTTALFRSLDPGVIIYFDKQGYSNNSNPVRVISNSAADFSAVKHHRQVMSQLFPVLGEVYNLDKQYEDTVCEARSNAVSNYLEGNAEQAVVSIFKATGNRYLDYYDSRIEIPPAETETGNNNELYRRVVQYIVQGRLGHSDSFDGLLEGIQKYMMNVGPIIVNGVSVHYTSKETRTGAKLYYVNGKKISRSDKDHCLSQVTCYPDNQAGYDNFLSVISKISLKYHRAQKDGLEFHVRNLSQQAVETALAAAGFSDVGKSNLGKYGSVATCRVPFRKTAGNRGQIFLAGEWRSVLNFDMIRNILLRAGAGYSVRTFSNSKGQTYSLSTTDKHSKIVTDGDETMFSLLTYMDYYLAPESRIYVGTPTFMAAQASDSYFNHIKLGKMTNAEVKAFIGPCRAVLSEFSNSIADAITKFKKSKELLDETVERTETRVVEHEGETCYLVPANSGALYRIVESSAAVYNHRSNQHICIVNGHSDDYVGYDYIVSLILALKQDTRTSRAISTLGRHAGQEE